MQKFSIILKNALPDKIYENLLMKHYHLNLFGDKMIFLLFFF